MPNFFTADLNARKHILENANQVLQHIRADHEAGQVEKHVIKERARIACEVMINEWQKLDTDFHMSAAIEQAQIANEVSAAERKQFDKNLTTVVDTFRFLTAKFHELKTEHGRFVPLHELAQPEVCRMHVNATLFFSGLQGLAKEEDIPTVQSILETAPEGSTLANPIRRWLPGKGF